MEQAESTLRRANPRTCCFDVSRMRGDSAVPSKLGLGCGSSLGPKPCVASDLGAACSCRLLPGTNGAAFTAASESFVLLLFVPALAANAIHVGVDFTWRRSHGVARDVAPCGKQAEAH